MNYKCKVSFLQGDEENKKRKSRTILLDAINYTDCEAKLTEIWEEYESFKIKSIVPYKNCEMLINGDEGIYFEGRVVQLIEKKKVNTNFLVETNSIDNALIIIERFVKENTFQHWTVKSLKQSDIEEVSM